MLASRGARLLVGAPTFAWSAGWAMPSQARLLHLFTYNYKRPWPNSLDFRHDALGLRRGGRDRHARARRRSRSAVYAPRSALGVVDRVLWLGSTSTS
jgi:hypothetical protein